MNIPTAIRRIAATKKGLYEMSTGGGFDYIVLSLDRTTDILLCDPDDAGYPGFDCYGELYIHPQEAQAAVMLQISDFDEPRAWNAGGYSPVLFSGTARKCIDYMAHVAAINNITSEPNY